MKRSRNRLSKQRGLSAWRLFVYSLGIVAASGAWGSAFGQFGLQVNIDPPSPLDTEQVAVVVSGSLPDTCFWYGGGFGRWIDEIEYRIDLNIGFDGSQPCLTVLVPFQQSFDLGALSSGHYRIKVVAFEPETGSFESVETTFHVWSEPAETIVVELPEAAGFYPLLSEHNGEIDLGFSLFEIHVVSIRWAGSIATGAWSCFGGHPVGAGADFRAAFHPEASCWASHVEDSQIIGAQIPFDSTDSLSCHSGDTFELLLDGVATLHVSLQPFLGPPECGYVPPHPSGLLNSVTLAIAARRMHDFNGNARVNLDDAAEFPDCMSGPDGDLDFADCRIFDSDSDNDVDMTDCAAFQRAFTGP